MTDEAAVAAPKRKGAGKKQPVQSVNTETRWVVFSAPKGGPGKTSCCKNIAVAAAVGGKRVATIDFDRQRTLTDWHSLRQQYDVARIDNYVGSLDDVEAALAQIDPAAYDVVFVDTPPSVEDHPVANKILLRRADLVLVPTGVGRFDKQAVIKWMGYLRGYGCRAAFLLNRVKRPSVGIVRKAKNELSEHGRLVPHEIPDLDDMHSVDDYGFSVVDTGDAKKSAEIVGAWNFVKHELEM